jgi:hypothetical protein
MLHDLWPTSGCSQSRKKRVLADSGVMLDSNCKSSGHIEGTSPLFVGALAKFYYQRAPKISKRRFHLLLPVVHSQSFWLIMLDFKWKSLFFGFGRCVKR